MKTTFAAKPFVPQSLFSTYRRPNIPATNAACSIQFVADNSPQVKGLQALQGFAGHVKQSVTGEKVLQKGDLGYVSQNLINYSAQPASQKYQPNKPTLTASSLATPDGQIGQPKTKSMDRSTIQLVRDIKKAKEVKREPIHKDKYTPVELGDRTYYHRYDKLKRTQKISGRIKYTKDKRKATRRVPNKRKTDQSGHLIAHSFGGPANFSGNFVAMDKFVNSAGGSWGKMESRIRKRLKAQSTVAYMSVTLKYPNTKIRRPNSAIVTVHFNRPPKRESYTIDLNEKQTAPPAAKRPKK